MRAALLLLLATLAAHGAQLLRGWWSGTEAFRTLIAHGMVESGDYLVPRLGGELMLTKPPLFYWLLAGVDHLAGLHPVAMRVPSVVAIWLAAWLVLRVLERRFDPRTAWIGALGLVASPAWLWHGAFAEIDPVFAAFTVVSIVWLAEAVATGSMPRFVAAGLCGSLALLTKGPPYFLFLLGVLPVWWGRPGPRVGPALAFAGSLLAPFAAYYAVLLGAPGALDTGELSGLAAEESVGRIASYDLRSLVGIPVYLAKVAAATLPLSLSLFVLGGRPRLAPEPERLRRACLWAFVVGSGVLVLFPERPGRYLIPGIGLAVVALAPAAAAWSCRPAPVAAGVRTAVRAVGALAALAVIALPWLPHPMPGWSWYGALAVAGGALLVRSRVAVVAFVLAVPAVVVATVAADREEYRTGGLRSERHVTELLRAELRERGTDRFEVWGYATESIVLELDPSTRWNIRDLATPPPADWVLSRIKDDRDPFALPHGFAERVRVRGHRQDFVLAERVR